jgi:hypothetical protein
MDAPLFAVGQAGSESKGEQEASSKPSARRKDGKSPLSAPAPEGLTHRGAGEWRQEAATDSTIEVLATAVVPTTLRRVGGTLGFAIYLASKDG